VRAELSDNSLRRARSDAPYPGQLKFMKTKTLVSEATWFTALASILRPTLASSASEPGDDLRQAFGSL